jgi:hypothetical protein
MTDEPPLEEVAATHGVEAERGEGAVAHLWQLLMAAQLPGTKDSDPRLAQ